MIASPLRGGGVRALALLAAVLLGGAAPAPAVDLAQYPRPRVVLTEDGSGGVLWWDATMWVDRLLADAVPRDAALRALEYEAVKLFVTRAPELPPNVRHLRVVVAFAKTGLVSGPYRTRPDAGVRTLLTVEGDVRLRSAPLPGWEADARRGVFPAGVTVKPSDDLPQTLTRDDVQ